MRQAPNAQEAAKLLAREEVCAIVADMGTGMDDSSGGMTGSDGGVMRLEGGEMTDSGEPAANDQR